jgi:hypothetical protein
MHRYIRKEESKSRELGFRLEIGVIVKSNLSTNHEFQQSQAWRMTKHSHAIQTKLNKLKIRGWVRVKRRTQNDEW